MIYAIWFIIMFVLLRTAIIISDFPENIWVASFMVYAFQVSTILQSGVYICTTPCMRNCSLAHCNARPAYYCKLIVNCSTVNSTTI